MFVTGQFASVRACPLFRGIADMNFLRQGRDGPIADIFTDIVGAASGQQRRLVDRDLRFILTRVRERQRVFHRRRNQV
jgi:hypothetical protein